MLNIIKEAKPKVIFNLAGQTDVHSSFIIPKATTEVNSIGFINILEALKILGWAKETTVFQALTSEMFGAVKAGTVLN